MFAFFRTRVGLGPERRGWKESDLLIHCKSDPAELAIAARLRQETTLSVKAIAGRMPTRFGGNTLAAVAKGPVRRAFFICRARR